MEKFKVYLFPLFVSFGLISSAYLWPSQDDEHSPEGEPAFNYSGNSGPEYWGDLDPSFDPCGSGQNQSPINIECAREVDLPNIEFNYQLSKINLVNNGSTVQANFDQGSCIDIEGEKFELQQLHFHAPSEHKFKGESFPVELHLVHNNKAHQLAVIGIMLVEGIKSAPINSILKRLPAESGAEIEIEELFNAADLLPVIKTTYRYSGSLTTPPCTEGVRWFVMTQPVEISAQQITAFEQVYYGNNRPLQPLNNREVVKDSILE